jgi:uncharacterized repeat protein (TIGR03803 family)
MKKNRLLTDLSRVLAVVTVTLIITVVLTSSAWAATEQVLHSFTGGSDGQVPSEGLIWDHAGNLYSATWYGGTGCGVVFQLVPNGDGTWTENVLHNFKGGRDGCYPEWGSLTFDSVGNLYGTTSEGGEHGLGTVFELTANSHGNWTKTVLHNFKEREGGYPVTTLLFDATGNIYGTTNVYSPLAGGTIFKMTPGSKNHWTFQVIHEFPRTQKGFYPETGLMPGPDGAYYGTTHDENDPDDCYFCGTVYKLTSTSGGKWVYEVIHPFSGNEGGADPGVGQPVFDSQGNLFGPVVYQGAYGYGLIYELTPVAGGQWTFQVLYQFTGLDDGGNPLSGLMSDGLGNWYGTASSGGAYGYGVVFKLTPNQDGTWTESVVYDFAGSDGASPGAALLSDPAGNIYGVTTGGGAYGYGTVYEITP